MVNNIYDLSVIKILLYFCNSVDNGVPVHHGQPGGKHSGYAQSGKKRNNSLIMIGTWQKKTSQKISMQHLMDQPISKICAAPTMSRCNFKGRYVKNFIFSDT